MMKRFTIDKLLNVVSIYRPTSKYRHYDLEKSSAFRFHSPCPRTQDEESVIPEYFRREPKQTPDPFDVAQGQAKLVLRLGDAEIILGCADRLAQVPDLIGEGVQVGQRFWLLLARFLCDLHAQPRFIGLLR